MSTFIKIACVVVFILVMVAIGKGFTSLAGFFDGDFPLGFIAGFWFAIALVFACQKLEAWK